ncbi:ABC transporter ATP-binding protein [Acidomonas methanolica]|uniref:ABC transporter ATP-binding protein n=1 Tax=Acidomonas methanolica TaxID=437 RepID=UPI00211A9B92|nr:ABC transporter ATP-binding protein [Acidomonas methanolica]MCQ9156434.1 ABC transporter ATP-binding protein [Acidomonas methanolica]
MARLKLNSITKHFGRTTVLPSIDLTVRDGEFLVLVGPSGCGKSTLLRLIAGLESPSSGSIFLDDRDVTSLPPVRRGVAMVFQSYALYPHMTVRENIGFGLRIAGMPTAERKAAVEAVARTLKLEPLLDRLPAALSGGQRQRVAIGRAMVRKPRLFLFDEPLSNLDAELRAHMRLEIARLHRTLGATMIYVTHDQVEAMTLADRIAVLKDGRIEQMGTPDELFHKPANLFVARFLGTPKMNAVAAEITAREGSRLFIRAPDLSPALITIEREWNTLPAPGQHVTLGWRPTRLEDGIETSSEPEILHVEAQIDLVEWLGRSAHITLTTPRGLAFSCETWDHPPRLGEIRRVSIPQGAFMLFGADGRRLS